MASKILIRSVLTARYVADTVSHGYTREHVRGMLAQFVVTACRPANPGRRTWILTSRMPVEHIDLAMFKTGS